MRRPLSITILMIAFFLVLLWAVNRADRIEQQHTPTTQIGEFP